MASDIQRIVEVMPEEPRQHNRFLRRLTRHRLGTGALLIFTLIITSVVFAPLIAPQDPNQISLKLRNSPPDGAHWLGTDHLGRDIFARLLYGGRASLSVGVAGISIAVSIGVILGTISGFLGGKVDAALLKLSEVVMSFPGFIIILTLVSLLGPSLFTVMAVLGFIQWTGIYRIVRNQLLSLREREFVLAAQALGAGWPAMAFRHLLPNAHGTGDRRRHPRHRRHDLDRGRPQLPGGRRAGTQTFVGQHAGVGPKSRRVAQVLVDMGPTRVRHNPGRTLYQFHR